MENKVKVVGIVSVVVMIAIMYFFVTAVSDKNGPVITIENTNDIVYTEGENESVLLQGVTAMDKRDGDVTDSLRVDNVIVDGEIIKVKYAAKDSKNNITISSGYREIKYISSTTDSVVDSEETDDTEEKTSEEISSEEIQEVVDEIDKEEADKTGIPVITLLKNEATIYVGQTFSDMVALSYVKETYDNSGDVSRRIRIAGNEEQFQEGDYEIKFTVSDTDGNVSKPAILVLHVVAGD